MTGKYLVAGIEHRAVATDLTEDEGTKGNASTRSVANNLVPKDIGCPMYS
jgi:hypothetical protein